MENYPRITTALAQKELG